MDDRLVDNVYLPTSVRMLCCAWCFDVSARDCCPCARAFNRFDGPRASSMVASLLLTTTFFFDIFWGGFWAILGRFLEVFGRFLATFSEVFGRCLGGVLKVFRRFFGGGKNLRIKTSRKPIKTY